MKSSAEKTGKPTTAGSVFATIALILVVWVIFFGDKKTPEKISAEREAEVAQAVVAAQIESLEYKLAIVNAGRRVSQDDVTVARFRWLLSSLSQKYPESPQQIADMTVKAKEMLRDKGVAVSLLEIMEGMNQLSVVKGMRYAETLAAFVVLASR